jgi:hypothetical protein
MKLKWPFVFAGFAGLLGAAFAAALYSTWDIGQGYEPTVPGVVFAALFWGGFTAIFGFVAGFLVGFADSADEKTARYEDVVARLKNDREEPPPPP